MTSARLFEEAGRLGEDGGLAEAVDGCDVARHSIGDPGPLGGSGTTVLGEEEGGVDRQDRVVLRQRIAPPFGREELLGTPPMEFDVVSGLPRSRPGEPVDGCGGAGPLCERSLERLLGVTPTAILECPVAARHVLVEGVGGRRRWGLLRDPSGFVGARGTHHFCCFTIARDRLHGRGRCDGRRARRRGSDIGAQRVVVSRLRRRHGVR